MAFSRFFPVIEEIERISISEGIFFFKRLLLSKIDSVDDLELSKKEMPKNIKTVKISSITGKNLEKAIESIAYLVSD